MGEQSIDWVELVRNDKTAVSLQALRLLEASLPATRD